VSAGVLSERSLPARPSQFERTGVLGVKLVDGALFSRTIQVRDDPAWVDERREA